MRDRNDRRVIKVHLTPKGWELQSVLPKLAEAVNKRAVDNFEKSEREAILNLTKRIHRNLTNSD
jgi:DNA-binding MarR family transcriptional regulator